MKKILSILVTLTFCTSTLWAEQVTVKLYDAGIQPVPKSHELIIQTAGSTNTKAVEDWWNSDGFINPFNSNEQWGDITFTALEGTVLGTYYFDIHPHFNSSWIGGYSPKYKVNGGEEKTINSNSMSPEQNNNYNSGSLIIEGKPDKSTFGAWGFPRFKNFQFTIVVPEVVPMTTTTTTLEKLTDSDLEGGTITRTGYVPFVVKDPIDQTNPQNYFSATISAGATGESWTVLKSGWSCEANAGSFIVRVPVQYTATNKQKGTFSTTVHLESKNTYNTANDDQNAQITVGDVKQDYAISWGNSWVDGSEVDLFKGDIYPRTGNGGYLANTAGLTLGTPVVTEVLENPTGASTLVSFAANGAMTLHETGKVRLTYTQPGSTTHNEKRLTLTVNIIKRTPAFTLKSDEYVDGVHIFYVNHEYIPFVESSNEDFVNYPIEVTNNNSDNDQFISFVAENAITHAVPKEDIQITVHQDAGDLWNESSVTYTIAIRENPIHVGTLCDRTPAELLQDDRCYIGGSLVAFEGNDILLGSTAGNTNGGWAVFKFVGTPDKLQWSYTTTDGSGTWKAEQSVDGDSFYELTNGDTFDEMARYLRLSIVGNKAKGKITDLCITEKVGASITPDPIELVVMDDGNGGKLVSNATFTASVSNLTELTLQLSSDEFILVRDGKTYNETDNTLLLDYTDGLGIDKNASAVVTVQYDGVDDPANAAGKTCTVTAFDENGAEQAAATIQIIEITTTDGAPNIIVAANAEQTGIYTGTEHDGNKHPKNGTFPYKTKQQVNVASAFADGKPLFDRLYIFGLTKNKSNQTTTTSGVQYHTITTPNATNPSPAITPCYIYDKEGSGYRLTQTIADMNPTSGTKPLPALTASGQKLYYTGYCPYASNGCAGEKGVILITGGAGAKVDVYLENLYLYARPHTQSGASKILTTDTLKMNMGLGDGNYVGLSASAFTFEATSSTPFAPTIHVRDSNKLEGGAGALHASLLTKSATAGIHSAPIHLMVSNENHAHNMTIDDKWPIHASGTVERTNGKLDLCPTSSGRPCVELGNAKSVLNFNGGQIYLKNSVPTSANYLCTFAIGHRSYTKTVSVVSATLHGLGTDRGDGTVNFNDGTINCRELSDANMNAYGGYYRSKTSMKCPQNTYINGGTFNCDIWACSEAANLGASPQNKYNNPLVSVTCPINNTPVEPYYLATIDFDALATSLICQDPTHTDYYGKSLADYYSGKDKYGYSSMKANADNNVTLMLPYQFTDKEFEVEETVINWATCMPTVNATAMVEGVEQTVQYGGPTTVLNSETEHTRFLFYVDIDTYTMEAAGPDAGYKTPEMFGLGSVEVAFNDGEYRNNVENETFYEVSEAQYLATPIIGGDEWFLFCPPFDITNVYVVESYSEARLKEQVEADQDRYNAQILQAEAAVDLFFYVGYETTFNQTNANLWTIHRQWKEDGTPNKGAGATKLTHFTGSNYDANYYLQRSSGTWGWNSETSRFVTDWEYLHATMEKVTHGDKEYNVVMRKGQIYSMKFPYKYYGYRDESSANWDYWTGKYLIFEGLGPQTIEGKNYHQDIKKAMTVAAGSAEIRANNTLASMEVSGMGAYYLGENQRFWPSPTDNTSKEIYPSQGFILLNKPAVSPLPQRIASIDMMTGDVTYEPGDGSENTVTGTPTIAGEREMLVYTVAGGLGVVPVVPQHVSIYNAAGQLVVSQYLTDNTQFALPTGIYLVRGEKDQAKAMVK